MGQAGQADSPPRRRLVRSARATEPEGKRDSTDREDAGHKGKISPLLPDAGTDGDHSELGGEPQDQVPEAKGACCRGGWQRHLA